MLPSIKEVALVGVGLMVGFAAGYWVGRRRQPGVVPPAVQLPNSYSEMAVNASASPSANDSYAKFLGKS